VSKYKDPIRENDGPSYKSKLSSYLSILPNENEMRNVISYDGDPEGLMSCDMFVLYFNEKIDTFVKMFEFFKTIKVVVKLLEIIIAYGLVEWTFNKVEKHF